MVDYRRLVTTLLRTPRMPWPDGSATHGSALARGPLAARAKGETDLWLDITGYFVKQGRRGQGLRRRPLHPCRPPTRPTGWPPSITGCQQQRPERAFSRGAMIHGPNGLATGSRITIACASRGWTPWGCRMAASGNRLQWFSSGSECIHRQKRASETHGARSWQHGRLAQLVRARGSHPRGHWFESSIAHHFFLAATDVAARFPRDRASLSTAAPHRSTPTPIRDALVR